MCLLFSPSELVDVILWKISRCGIEIKLVEFNLIASLNLLMKKKVIVNDVKRL